MFAKNMNISLLLDFYGDILSERRREIMELYYNEDLSLSEIAEIKGISRQGVRDSVKKSEAELCALEEKLGLAERFKNLKGEISSITELLKGAASSADADAAGKINNAITELEELDI